MNFAELLSLAKQNDKRAKVEIKSSKAPVTEYTKPVREVKAKPDPKVIQARLKEHQQRVQQAEKLNQKGPATPSQGTRIGSNISGKSPSRSVIAAGKTAIVAGEAKSAASSVSLSKQGVQPVVASKNASSSVGQNGGKNAVLERKLNPPNLGKASSSKPASSTTIAGKPTASHPTKNHHRPAEPKTKIRPAVPPQPSFSSLLKMASVQQANPQMSLMPPPPPPAQRSRQEEIKLSGQKARLASHSNDARRKEWQNSSKTPQAKTKIQDVTSSRNSNMTSSRNLNVTSSHLIKNTQRPSTSSAYGKELPRRTVPAQQPRDVSQVSHSRHGMQNGSSLPRKTVSQLVSREPVRQSTSSAEQRNPRFAQAKQISTVVGKIVPPSRTSGGATSSSRPAPPSAAQPATRVNRVYPNGPSFPAFRPPPRKRVHPDRYQDEDSDYDEEMDDFIVDSEEDDGDPSSISDHIRQIFGYDRRRYAGREIDDDDDLRHMETGVHTLWREEERSAEIGRLEDEIAEEEELEEERKALQKKRDLLRKKKKIAHD